MRFHHVTLAATAVVLPDEVWTSAFIEEKLAPLYERLRLPAGRLELMTGIRERRFWSRPMRPSEASAQAGRLALKRANLDIKEVDLLIHAGVCRDHLEPATAAYVHHLLGAPGTTQFLDVSNACLGFLNALVLAAGLIESGQIRRALICSGENGRPLVERTIAMLNTGEHDRQSIKPCFANLTIGAGAAAIVISHDTLAPAAAPRLLGGAARADSSACNLCEGDAAEAGSLVMRTDSERLLESGLALAAETWSDFTRTLHWSPQTPSLIITHQVGHRHSQQLFERLGLPLEHDWRSFEFLGNVGSVSVPATLSLASDAGATPPGALIALLGIGSGLASAMLGIRVPK